MDSYIIVLVSLLSEVLIIGLMEIRNDKIRTDYYTVMGRAVGTPGNGKSSEHRFYVQCIYTY